MKLINIKYFTYITLFNLKKVLYLVILYFQIQDNNKFYQKLYLFFKYIIKYFTCLNLYLKILYHIYLKTKNLIIISKFEILFK